MLFIKLTNPNDTESFVNMHHVRDIFKSSTGSTILMFDENHSTPVQESPEEIFKKVNDELSKPLIHEYINESIGN